MSSIYIYIKDLGENLECCCDKLYCSQAVQLVSESFALGEDWASQIHADLAAIASKAESAKEVFQMHGWNTNTGFQQSQVSQVKLLQDRPIQTLSLFKGLGWLGMQTRGLQCVHLSPPNKESI